MSEKALHKGWYSKFYHYSCHNSHKFWRRVNAIKDKKDHHELYHKGCMLQNLEHQMLKMLADAETKQRTGQKDS